MHIERGWDSHLCEFLLFPDCLLWLESDAQQPSTPMNPSGERRRRSDNAPGTLKSGVLKPSAIERIQGRYGRRRQRGEVWTYEGRAELIDIDVIMPVGKKRTCRHDGDGARLFSIFCEVRQRSAASHSLPVQRRD
ncbi:hypothetical protein EXIGLDRAFT_767144 [Exidia glandulosa HHB12029]|uniref:Uncharacterized protein n=1 Tax=Exidia glandulosa HHB12029 TaxID=1314781 RepID=A0A165J6F6_EXIGL|nr:hypothetical protein EXIGLDRAFT_767144 [Exidia glandulosa HHB12029]